MTHKAILEMIKAVDPSDNEKLDEIDAAVRVFLGWDKQFPPNYSEFTRSRDSLKAIRPEGWFLLVFENNFNGFISVIQNIETGEGFVGRGKTEELAELHAIIQSIAHERGERDE